jgi:hypothetical protein
MVPSNSATDSTALPDALAASGADCFGLAAAEFGMPAPCGAALAADGAVEPALFGCAVDAAFDAAEAALVDALAAADPAAAPACCAAGWAN